MSLAGLLKHMSYVEDHWFSRALHGADPAPPWDAVDWNTNPEGEWNSAVDDRPVELFALWDEGGALAARVVAALSDGDLEQLAARRWPDGRAPSLRWILCHMIEEYARHNGHADLLRESVDGLTGE